MKKLLAFTLAETLIVIGIIGVVSALTLPNLNSSTGEKEKIAKVKKIYQNLDDALGRAQAIYGPFDEWFVNDTTAAAQYTRFQSRITEFLKVSKNCGTATGCWPTHSKNANDDEYDGYMGLGNQRQSVILADGTAVLFSRITIGGESTISFDIDGPNKGPNKWGTDLFCVFINNENTLVADTLDYIDANENHVAWILNTDNMDYLKCSGLSWPDKTSCK